MLPAHIKAAAMSLPNSLSTAEPKSVIRITRAAAHATAIWLQITRLLFLKSTIDFSRDSLGVFQNEVAFFHGDLCSFDKSDVELCDTEELVSIEVTVFIDGEDGTRLAILDVLLQSLSVAVYVAIWLACQYIGWLDDYKLNEPLSILLVEFKVFVDVVGKMMNLIWW